jgi:hypothetical protein
LDAVTTDEVQGESSRLDRLTRDQLRRTLDALAEASRASVQPAEVTHEVVTLWWSLPGSTDGEVTGIEGLDDLEERLIVRLYSLHDDLTDQELPIPIGDRDRVTTEFWSTVEQLHGYVRARD